MMTEGTAAYTDQPSDHTPGEPEPDLSALDCLIGHIGSARWQARIDRIGQGTGPRTSRACQQRHAVELVIERLRRKRPNHLTRAERRVARLAQDCAILLDDLPPARSDRLRTRLHADLGDGACLIPTFHLLHTARLQAGRGFAVDHAGLDDAAPCDLLLYRDQAEMELACATISAEAGRGVQRGAWFELADRIDPDLQTWLETHPGRYLLNVTLPHGLKAETPDASGQDASQLAVLHARITAMLEAERRADYDAAAMLRLDPLLIAAAQADALRLAPKLRQEFGPEAHLSVTQSGGGLFVMAARAGAENDIAAATRRHLQALAPTRFSGTRPGVLSVFIDDIDRAEWRGLRDSMALEGEARTFLTTPEAGNVVAVTCTSRLELFGEDDAAEDGELRFRNPVHPAAKAAALAPSVLSTL